MGNTMSGDADPHARHREQEIVQLLQKLLTDSLSLPLFLPSSIPDMEQKTETSHSVQPPTATRLESGRMSADRGVSALPNHPLHAFRNITQRFPTKRKAAELPERYSIELLQPAQAAITAAKVLLSEKTKQVTGPEHMATYSGRRFRDGDGAVSFCWSEDRQTLWIGLTVDAERLHSVLIAQDRGMLVTQRLASIGLSELPISYLQRCVMNGKCVAFAGWGLSAGIALAAFLAVAGVPHTDAGSSHGHAEEVKVLSELRNTMLKRTSCVCFGPWAMINMGLAQRLIFGENASLLSRVVNVISSDFECMIARASRSNVEGCKHALQQLCDLQHNPAMSMMDKIMDQLLPFPSRALPTPLHRVASAVEYCHVGQFLVGGVLQSAQTALQLLYGHYPPGDVSLQMAPIPKGEKLLQPHTADQCAVTNWTFIENGVSLLEGLHLDVCYVKSDFLLMPITHKLALLSAKDGDSALLNSCVLYSYLNDQPIPWKVAESNVRDGDGEVVPSVSCDEVSNHLLEEIILAAGLRLFFFSTFQPTALLVDHHDGISNSALQQQVERLNLVLRNIVCYGDVNSLLNTLQNSTKRDRLLISRNQSGAIAVAAEAEKRSFHESVASCIRKSGVCEQLQANDIPADNAAYLASVLQQNPVVLRRFMPSLCGTGSLTAVSNRFLPLLPDRDISWIELWSDLKETLLTQSEVNPKRLDETLPRISSLITQRLADLKVFVALTWSTMVRNARSVNARCFDFVPEDVRNAFVQESSVLNAVTDLPVSVPADFVKTVTVTTEAGRVAVREKLKEKSIVPPSSQRVAQLIGMQTPANIHAVADCLETLLPRVFFQNDLQKTLQTLWADMARQEDAPIIKEMQNRFSRHSCEILWMEMQTVWAGAQLDKMIQDHFVIGVVGNGKVGKSTLLANVFSVNSHGGAQQQHRTAVLNVFPADVAGKIVLFDLPGSDHIASTSGSVLWDAVRVMDAIIVMVDGISAGRLQASINLLSSVNQARTLAVTSRSSQRAIPMLVCLNRTDHWLDQLSESEDHDRGALADEFRLQLCDRRIRVQEVLEKAAMTVLDRAGVTVSPELQHQILVQSVAIQPTCIMLQRENVDDMLREHDVWGDLEVRAWIRSCLPESFLVHFDECTHLRTKPRWNSKSRDIRVL